MQKNALRCLLLILSFIGLADAWYLTESAYEGATLSCNIAGLDGCNVVAQSAYSHLLGFPLALYGVGFYAFVFALSALLLIFPLRFVYRTLSTLGVLGAIASFCFLLIQFLIIKAVCIYCLASAIITLLIWLVSRALWRRFAPPKLITIA